MVYFVYNKTAYSQETRRIARKRENPGINRGFAQGRDVRDYNFNHRKGDLYEICDCGKKYRSNSGVKDSSVRQDRQAGEIF